MKIDSIAVAGRFGFFRDGGDDIHHTVKPLEEILVVRRRSSSRSSSTSESGRAVGSGERITRADSASSPCEGVRNKGHVLKRPETAVEVIEPHPV